MTALRQRTRLQRSGCPTQRLARWTCRAGFERLSSCSARCPAGRHCRCLQHLLEAWISKHALAQGLLHQHLGWAAPSPAHRPCWHIWLTPAQRSVLSARAMVANEQQQAQHACTQGAIACEQLHNGLTHSLAGQATNNADIWQAHRAAAGRPTLVLDLLLGWPCFGRAAAAIAAAWMTGSAREGSRPEIGSTVITHHQKCRQAVPCEGRE